MRWTLWTSARAPRRQRDGITVLGNFGTGNLGNECTLQAFVFNLRRYLPRAPITCVCPGPDDAARRHGVSGVAMSSRPSGDAAGRRGAMYRHPLVRLLRRLLVRLPAEVVQWRGAFRSLRHTRLLVMPGTGMLGDFGIGPADLHYEIFKWSLLAKVRGCRVLFVSDGATPLAHPLSRGLVRSALALADYRSYRDPFSRACLRGTVSPPTAPPRHGDLVYPDLAFSFPRPALPVARRSAQGPRVVGLGLMEYRGRGGDRAHGERVYRDYLARLGRFAAWLVQHDYAVRLIVSDNRYDTHVTHDFLEHLEQRGLRDARRRFVQAPATEVADLLSQLAATDLVVATRFHTVLLALMLTRPVISLSYEPKNDALLATMGLAEYSQHIEQFDVDVLIAQFTELERNAARLAARLEHAADAQRAALDEQYRFIVGAFGAARVPGPSAEPEMLPIPAGRRDRTGGDPRD
jgi:polysaccharide pyruvyl transferase WcaK-like protein